MTYLARLANSVLCLATILAAYPTRSLAEPGGARSVASPVSPDQQISFYIPAQPLDAAIEAYGNVTGLQVLNDARLVIGRSSTEIVGNFTAEFALRALLSGTGLLARYTGPNAVVIVPIPSQQATAEMVGAVALRGANAEQRRYYGLLQAGIASAFCLNSETRWASNRIALSLWIDAAGAVRRFRILGSTASAGLTRTLGELMRHVTIGESPPPGMVQPFTIVILPRSSAAGCP